MEIQTLAPVPTPVSQPAEELDDLLKSVAGRADVMRREITLLAGELKVLKRLAARAVRAPRRRRPQDATDPDRKPSGFARPSPLSDQLCAVLGVDNGTEMPRTLVTRMICKIIKDEEINDSVNKRQIDLSKPQAHALKALLSPEPGATITYFNLQKYLKKHIGPACDATNTETPAPAAITAPATAPEPAAATDAAKPKRQRQA
jgi:chromatin remodeling complex protein RSC6